MKMIKKISISLSVAMLLATSATAAVYVVKDGDTVGKIAQNLGFKSIKESGITSVPSGNLAMIYVGDKITYTGTVSEESLGLRKTDLYSEKPETTGDETKYGTSYAGSGHKINRAFQDAPPMIPHDVEGMLPITINNNQCTSCHMPDVAVSMNATPLPSSHFTDFRPKHSFDGKMFAKASDNMKNEMAIEKTDKLQGARFNCTQCHAPQSTGDLVVENTFEAVFSDKDGATKSSWSGTRLTDDLNTLGDNSAITTDDLKNANSAAGHLPGEH